MTARVHECQFVVPFEGNADELPLKFSIMLIEKDSGGFCFAVTPYDPDSFDLDLEASWMFDMEEYEGRDVYQDFSFLVGDPEAHAWTSRVAEELSEDCLCGAIIADVAPLSGDLRINEHMLTDDSRRLFGLEI